MKLEQIMKDEDSLLGGKWFKRKYRSYCVRWSEDKYLFEMLAEKCVVKNKAIAVYHFNPEDFGVDDWKWVEEKWYEGNFKKKYPNGVLCWVWKSYNSSVHKRVIVDCDPVLQKFKTDTGTWVYAEPVKSNEAPAIIGDKND